MHRYNFKVKDTNLITKLLSDFSIFSIYLNMIFLLLNTKIRINWSTDILEITVDSKMMIDYLKSTGKYLIITKGAK